jgi:hypothetical protein
MSRTVRSPDGRTWTLERVKPESVIWLIERVFSTTRPNVRAHTDGPPPQTFTWRTTHRYGLSGIEDRIAGQIENGQLGDEPPGTVLVGL